MRIVRVGGSVKFWLDGKAPSVDAVRPACCLRCSAPGRTAAGRCVLYGHGLRFRQLLGPAVVGGVAVVTVRRYQCQQCPGFHMVRYHGVLSSRSALRRQVVPKPPAPVENPLLPEPVGQLALCFGAAAVEEPPGAAKRRPWAWLLRHVCEVEVSICERCGGAMKWVQVATEPAAIARVLGELGIECAAFSSGARVEATLETKWGVTIAP